jgi:colanic acid biosynthesis glycosyl transferase WcaI
MRVIVWGINYAPELTGIAPFNTGLCDFLRGRGHTVEMATSFPYYPFWRKVPGDAGMLYRSDDVDGVLVHRCWLYVPRRVTTLRRIAHEFSFGLTSFARLVFLARPDVYVVVSPPLILGLLATVLGWIKRRPFIFHVQDLQPDAAVGLGMVKVGRLTALLYRIEAWSYRYAARVSGISSGMLEAYERKRVPKEKIVYFPNWLRAYGRNIEAPSSDPHRVSKAAAFRSKHSICKDCFLVSYSGNLGRKQGLETLVEAAGLLQNAEKLKSGYAEKRKVFILIVGDGAVRAELEARAASYGLANVRMMPLLVETDYQGMLAASDMCLILQAPGTGQYFFPSKLLSVLSARSPVLTVADESSELAKAVNEGGFGVNVLPGSPDALAGALERFAGAPDEVARFAKNTVWVDRFGSSRVLGDFEKVLEAVVRERNG